MKAGTIVGFTLGVSLAYLVATRFKSDIKEKGKKLLKDKICEILD